MRARGERRRTCACRARWWSSVRVTPRAQRLLCYCARENGQPHVPVVARARSKWVSRKLALRAQITFRAPIGRARPRGVAAVRRRQAGRFEFVKTLLGILHRCFSIFRRCIAQLGWSSFAFNVSHFRSANCTIVLFETKCSLINYECIKVQKCNALCHINHVVLYGKIKKNWGIGFYIKFYLKNLQLIRKLSYKIIILQCFAYLYSAS